MEKDTYSFNGLLSSGSQNYAEISANNRAFSERQGAFVKEITAITSIADNEQKKILLRAKVSDVSFLPGATSSELTAVYIALRDMGDFKGMIDLYNAADNQDFLKAPMIREFLAVAYNKNKEPAPNPDMAIKVASELVADKQESGDVYGSLGKAYLLKHFAAETEEDKKKFMEKSAFCYEQGFANFAEFYPGINAVYRNIALGKNEKAKQLAHLVYLSCLKDGAEETTDYWCSTSKLEASCIAGLPKDKIEVALQDVLDYDVPAWQFETTIETLKGVAPILSSDNINMVLKALEQKAKGNDVSSAFSDSQKNAALKYAKVFRALRKGSYNYRGLASNFEGTNTVGGNFKFGGQLPDHTISRKDLELFKGVLETKISDLFPPGEIPQELEADVTLNQIKDPEQFLKYTDKIIRYHYGTENFLDSGLHLENNAEIKNSTYDCAVKSLIKLGGKKQNAEDNSRTNIVAMFALGLGDCRHHAQVKQILFDVWQKKQMKDILQKAYWNINSGFDNGFSQTDKDFYNVLSVELRTLDVDVKVPVKLDGMYEPVLTEQGKYIKDENPTVPLEEHTLNIVIKRKGKDELESVCLKDAFYQNRYQWGDKKVNLDDLKISEDGRIVIPAGVIDKAKVAEGQDLPISLSPTVYAGKRDSVVKDNTGAKVSVLGIDVAAFSDKKDFIRLLQNRNRTKTNMQNMVEWAKSENTTKAFAIGKAVAVMH